MFRSAAIFAALSLTACAANNVGPNLAQGKASYRMMPATERQDAEDYRIGPLDAIDVFVYQEPDLSAKAVQVDAAGNIFLPLIGRVKAAGKTASELGADLKQQLGAKYLEHPQVSVSVSASVSQRVTVQGEVTDPGVYPIQGHTTLLQAISLAKGETQVAALKQVVIFREINGQRMGAVFDLKAIRRGDQADPVVLGNDQVIVGFSSAKSAWRGVLTAAPLLNVFRPVVY